MAVLKKLFSRADTAMLGSVLIGALYILLLVPTPFQSHDAFKGLIVVVVAGLGSLLYALGAHENGRALKRGALFVILALVFLVGLSALFSGTFASVVGVVFERGTGASLFALTGAMLLSAYAFRTSSARMILLKNIIIAIGACAGILLIDGALFGFLEEGEALSGALSSFTFLAALAWILWLSTEPLLRPERHYLALALCALAAVASLLLLGPFRDVVFVVIISGIILSVQAFSSHERGRKGAAILLIAALILVSRMFGISLPAGEAEYKPSFDTTLQVLSSALSQDLPSFLLGVGPGRFDAAWAAHMPPSVSRTPFWNTTFDTGSSTFMTRLVELGFLTTTLAAIAALLILWRLWVTPSRSGSSYRSAVLVTIVGVFIALWASLSVLDIAGEFIIALLAGASLRAAFGKETGESEAGSKSAQLIARGLAGFGGAALCMAGIAGLLAYAEYERGIALMREKRTDDGRDHLSKASLFPSSFFARAASEANQSRLEEALRSNDEALLPTVRESSETALASAKRAVLLDPRSFEAYLTLGNIHARRMMLGIKESAPLAKEAYGRANTLFRFSPLVHFSSAQFYYLAGDTEEAVRQLVTTLKLKPDYAEAEDLLQRILQQRI